MKIYTPQPARELMVALECRTNLQYTTPVSLYYAIWLGAEECCGVFGDGDNGAYEWFIWRKGALKTSDVGYGDCEVPLRTVLNQVSDRAGS